LHSNLPVFAKQKLPKVRRLRESRIHAYVTTNTVRTHYPDTGEANQFKLLYVEHAAANNLPAQMAPLLAGLGGLGSPGLGTPQATSPTKHSTSSSQKQSAKDRQSASSADAADGSADAPSDELAQLERGTYRNRFTCVRAAVPVVPLQAAAPLRATALGPQTAIVVGLAGEQLTTQRNHGVKVQFAWQRGASPLPGGLTETGSPDPASSDSGNAPGNETSGTWVRVAEALAGPNWGSQFTPRIGTEVLVDFLDGDMDQPVVVAQLYNGVDSPPFAAGVDAGVNHGGVISGWHSHNLNAGKEDKDAGGESGGYNQWVLDDTTGQLRMRLASSTAASQLSTGYLIGQSPNSAQRGSYRGSGFELRTDAWGVLRAPEGLLISTTTRAQTGTSVASSQMDTLEARAQLKGAQSLTEALQAAASQAQALGSTQVKDTQTAQKLLLERLDPKQKGSFKGQGVTSLNGQATQKAQAGSRELDTSPEAAVERFGAPLIVAEAPSSILMSSPASTAVFAGEQLHIVTQGDAQYGAAHTLSSVSGKSSTLFTHEGGLEAVAANGPLSIQAHTDQLELLADKEVTVVSVNDSISINAKTKIVLKAGQTSITLEGANITFACPGTFSVKGSGHSMDSGASSAAELTRLPDSKVKLFDEAFILKNKVSGALMANVNYRIKHSDGTYSYGTTDEKGRTHLVGGDKSEQVIIEVEA
jgi:type VI secretion system secreted protein VgrG